MTIQYNYKYTKFGFTGHETFPFRVSWLHKGVVAVQSNSRVFSNDNAIVELGVGKNMVRSIRHWCITLDLIKDTEQRGSYSTTKFGDLIFAEDGTDPYLEDTGTLWWLHWKLATNKERSTTWHYVFNHLSRPEFSKKNLMSELMRATTEINIRKNPSERTIESDIDCFIRTYTAPKKILSEESLECPLVELNLIKEDENIFRLIRGGQASIPDEILLATLVDYYKKKHISAKTISVENMLHSEDSPGRVFIFDENSFIERLERLKDLTNGNVVYDATAGMRQILFHNVPDILEVLESYYQRGRVS